MDTIFRLPGLNAAPGCRPEQLLTMQEAADALGLKYWLIQRAAKRGDIPTYKAFNGRKRVKLSEIVAFIEASREGGV